jgi:simple sugar transport system permease protein
MDILTAFLIATVASGTPLLLATLGEILTEKVGNLNLGVEGMMLMGASFSFIAGMSTQSPGLAVMAGMAAGGFGALIYAFLTVSMRANQVVTGLSLTIFGAGLADFVGKSVTGKTLPVVVTGVYAPVKIPLLGDIPVIGPALFNQSILVYFGYAIAILMWIYLRRTSQGLKARAVGENPAAADAAGIRVSGNKYAHIVMGGVLAGLAGAYLSLYYSPTWQPGITAGMGWIAVALVIFAMWNPLRAILGAYVFGGLRIIGLQFQQSIKIPTQFMDMLPYVVTVLVLIFVSIRKSRKNPPPGSLGTAYFREER